MHLQYSIKSIMDKSFLKKALISIALILFAYWLFENPNNGAVSTDLIKDGAFIPTQATENKYELKQSLQRLFRQWRQKHQKQYPSQQVYFYRRQIWLNNLEQILQHNERYLRDQASYFQGLNRFSDLTDSQFQSFYLSELPDIKFQTSTSLSKSQNRHFISRSHSFNLRNSMTLKCDGTVFDSPDPPSHLDWSQKMVSPSLDQGACGASWAYTTASSIESAHALKTGHLDKLSAQQLIDCSVQYGNQGCFGGWMDQAFWYSIDNGLTSEQQYPYTTESKKCYYSKTMKVVSVGSCAVVPSGNYSKMISAVTQQPVSVAIDARELKSYKGGVFDGECGEKINQGMLLVGFGAHHDQQKNATINFWKLKSFFGPDWGEKGYVLLEKQEQPEDESFLEANPGKCGILIAGSVPQNVQ